MQILRHCIKICFIFSLYIIIPKHCSILQENGTSEVTYCTDYAPKEKNVIFPISCYEIQKLDIGTCKNENGIIIGMDPAFNVRKIYELTLVDIKCMPAGALSGLFVHCLNLDDPVTVVHEKLFEGILTLAEFNVKWSRIKVIPDFRIVNNSIQIISIQGSRLISLGGRNLQNLTLIKRLIFANNSIRSIDPDVFQGTENVLLLDMSKNLLKFIPPNLLDHMKNLQTLFLFENNLLHVNNLFSVTYPKKINLSSNKITDVESVLDFNMKDVDILDLSNNPIKKLTESSFNEKIPEVVELYLNHCELDTFSTEYFYGIHGFEILDLSYNLIEDDFDPYWENFTDEYGFNLFVNNLDLTGNKLKTLKKILHFKEISKLQVAKNQIQYLTDVDFSFTFNVQHLELQENEIRWIDTNSFKEMRGDLEYLDMSYNFITALNGSISYFPNLITLNISNNIIQSFETDEFEGLVRLTYLYMQHNKIKTLSALFPRLSYLMYLNVTYNDIETINSDQIPIFLEAIDLRGNNLICDCRLLPFALLQTSKFSVKTDIDICLQSDFYKSLNNNSYCPDMCSCECTNNGNDYFLSVDCSSNNLTDVPQFLKRNFMQENINNSIDVRRPLVMKQNVYTFLNIKDRVLGINLENNRLESLQEAELPPDLIQLFLANNRLNLLPESIIDHQRNLRNVSLSGNSWICDCNTLKFKKWLTSKHEIIYDIDNVRCRINERSKSSLDGQIIWNLTDSELCPEDIELIILVSLGILILITFCLATKVLYTRYNLHIKVFLYSNGFTFVKEENLDYEKEFDAFVSFSHEDGEFVTKEIISGIEEKNPGIQLCIHYRHFIAGELIYNNIINAVRNSKRTVLILSKNFLESEWCLIEFRTAHMQAMEDKVHRIIVVKFGDLPREYDPDIRAYLDSTTYLTWGEKNFWNKLFYVLPTARNVENASRQV